MSKPRLMTAAATQLAIAASSQADDPPVLASVPRGLVERRTKTGEYRYEARVVYRRGARIVAVVPKMDLSQFGNTVPTWHEYVLSA